MLAVRRTFQEIAAMLILPKASLHLAFGYSQPFQETGKALGFSRLKVSIGLGDSGLNSSPKLAAYTPSPYRVVLPAPTDCFRESLGA